MGARWNTPGIGDDHVLRGASGAQQVDITPGRLLHGASFDPTAAGCLEHACGRRAEWAFGIISDFFEDWRFPTVVMSMLGAFVLLMVTILLIPVERGAAGAFAEAFRQWCFNYDPNTGRIEWAYLWMYVVQPLVLAAGVYALWRGPLRQIGSLRRAWPYVGVSIGIVAGLAVALFSLSGWEARPMFAFPADRIRTELTPPDFDLVNQDNEPVALASLRGRVVVVTAVYATCTASCPLILSHARRALAALADEEREDISVVAITLDPEHDRPAVLRRMADVYGVETPAFQLATGRPEYVEDVLDAFQFSRRHVGPGAAEAASGPIDHANLFVVIDRAGRIAYRFSLGEQQSRWLEEGLRQLIHEGVQPAT